MGVKDILKKYAQIAAVGSAAIAPAAFAEKTPERLPESPAPMQQSIKSTAFQWDRARFSPGEIKQLQQVYDSLPTTYKKFVGQDFDTRFERKEELSQRLYKQLMKENPNEQYFTGIDVQMHRDNLNITQINMAHDLILYGRPAESIDSTLPMNEQLRSCGFNEIAKVSEGTSFTDLSQQENGRFTHQMQWAQSILHDNPVQQVALRKSIRDAMPKDVGDTIILKDTQISNIPTQNINGSEIQTNPVGLSAAGIYHRDTVLKVADKLEKEEKSKIAALVQTKQTARR